MLKARPTPSTHRAARFLAQHQARRPTGRRPHLRAVVPARGHDVAAAQPVGDVAPKRNPYKGTRKRLVAQGLEVCGRAEKGDRGTRGEQAP